MIFMIGPRVRALTQLPRLSLSATEPGDGFRDEEKIT